MLSMEVLWTVQWGALRYWGCGDDGEGVGTGKQETGWFSQEHRRMARLQPCSYHFDDTSGPVIYGYGY